MVFSDVDGVYWSCLNYNSDFTVFSGVYWCCLNYYGSFSWFGLVLVQY